MSTELQEQFKNYVFEDVKANIDEWDSIGNFANLDEWNSIGNFGRYYADKEANRKFRDKIIELRRQYAKDNGLKTVTPLCPKPSDLMYPVRQFMDEYITSETARLIEEYKPLAIAKVLNDEALIKKINAELAIKFSEYAPYPLDGASWKLRMTLQDHYREIKHTLSNPARAVEPSFRDLANEIFKSLFTLSLKLKDNLTETIKKVA